MTSILSPLESSERMGSAIVVGVGLPLPLGVHPRGNGFNFAIFSRNATGVRLQIFDTPNDDVPPLDVELNPRRNRTGDIWHIWIAGVRPGQCYGYLVNGPYAPEQGHRFNPDKLLLDPFASACTPLADWDFGPALGYDPLSPRKDLSISLVDDAASMPKSLITRDRFDWEGDVLLRHPWSTTVIYETHVRGFTVHPSSSVEHPGTYRGLAERIPYLKNLGVTTIELMPILEFNENETTRVNPLTGERLKNYWGYSPTSFCAPKATYSSETDSGQQITEFKQLVRACHRADLEVILDVVFNHTAEGNELGPTICFRGLDNSIFYMLKEDKRFYRDFTGTGNTVNSSHPVVRDLILDALRHWVIDFHVDGFRFDLASVLGRDAAGNLVANPPLLERIAEDPILRDVKLIAEVWDAAGAYQVGSFSERRWAEWNGRYRDDVRRFWRGDEGMVGLLASRICGSSDLYERSGKGPESSINFVTCHDGFTLADLVSYEQKHNLANGENNQDGTDANDSNNFGVEGPSNDPAIEATRTRQIKNFLLTLFISRGVPMLLAGDEFRRTQQGNNNAYCQDNETSWVDWSFLERNADLHRFTRGMIAFRRNHPILSEETFYSNSSIFWFSPEGNLAHWLDPQIRQLACLIPESNESSMYLMFNAGGEPVTFALPTPRSSCQWYVAADTGRPSPFDLVDPGAEKPLETQGAYLLSPRASAILWSRPVHL